MKKTTIILVCALVAMAACSKSKEVHPEIGDGNDEIITVGMKDVHVKYTRTDHAELSRVVFHYSLAEVQQFDAAEMTKRETFFELALNDLLSDTLYSYYYELFYNGGETQTTEQSTFHTQAYDTPEPPTPPGGEHEYVDLGLPSGTLWATCNVGANSLEEFGDYFAWGETEIKALYSWETYKYCKNGDATSMIKYCDNPDYGYNGFTDNLTVLEAIDDAAVANWGNDWCMPTKEQYQELLDNTTGTWTNVNGVHGMLFVSNNGNSVFFPGAGGYEDDNVPEDDYIGCYWSSSLHHGDGAWCIEVRVGGYSLVESYLRRIGYPVRPVRKNDTPTPPLGDIPEGAINGLFTINENGDQVFFSQGNLQYQASTNTWRFAENQWDLLIAPEDMIYYGSVYGSVFNHYYADVSSHYTSTYSGWIDLFGWGTSGWNNGNTFYQPWDCTLDTTHYGPPGIHNLAGEFANADWGIFNAINNGGSQINLWRTLSIEEWGYLMETRNTPSGIRFVKARVNELNGIILLPDNWNESTYSLNNVNDGGAGYISNVILTLDWKNIFESAGAVFLPAAGYRIGTCVIQVDVYGHYWSNSGFSHISHAYGVYFDSARVLMRDVILRMAGRSVRLVQDAQ